MPIARKTKSRVFLATARAGTRARALPTRRARISRIIGRCERLGFLGLASLIGFATVSTCPEESSGASKEPGAATTPLEQTRGPRSWRRATDPSGTRPDAARVASTNASKNSDSAPAHIAKAGHELPASIDAILAELALDPSQVSVFLQRVDQTTPALLFNAQTPRAPASVEKLVTTMAALDILGRAYRWPTEVFTTGTLSEGTLSGNLFIKGYGDPTLSNGAYTDLLRALREKGIERIQGDLIIDTSAIEPPEAERGDFDGAAQSTYNALPAALSVNRQATDIHVYQDRTAGKVGVYTDPPLSGVEIDNRVQMVAAPCRGRNHRLRVKLADTERALAQIEVSGRFASECPDERISRLLLSPEQHAASAFHALWGQLGGQVEGHIGLGTVPEDAVAVHRATSPPLAELIRDVNKSSNNLMARLLFLTLGLQEQGPPASLEKSRETLMQWLDSKGIEHDGILIDNGSGLSRQSRLSAQTLGKLLVLGYNARWMPELMASMAIAGVDGTMARRLRHEPTSGRAHLKTGTLRDSSCIAGYVLDKNDRRWALVVMVNAIPGQRLAAWHGHSVHHELLRWVHDDPPPP
jgi:D-alanyl-D-alanine carboxypeptidase/D-alanyl-D-alanine-endopeptidase (penicillin-binding protein 4)